MPSSSRPADRPWVSVIIPTYNRAAFLPWSLSSVLDQTHRPLEVFVVDDGSSDETAASLEPYHSRIHYLRKDNGGKPAAINHALPLVRGDFLWVFDDDDVACPDALARHLRAFRQQPQAAFSYSGSYHCTTGGNPGNGILEVRSAHPPRPFADDEYLIELMLSSYAASPAVLVRTEVQRAAGLYCPELVRAEDFDMALRWGLLAPAVRVEGDRPTYYRRHHGGLRGPGEQRFEYSQNTRRSREAERAIMTRLGGTIRLSHYLPASWHQRSPGRLETAALMRRLAVRVRLGLWARACADLEALARRDMAGAPGTLDARLYLSRAVANAGTLDDLRRAGPDVDALRTLLRRRDLAPVRHDLQRGLFWHGHQRVRLGDWRGAWAALAAGRRLLGATGLGAGLWR